MGINESKRDGSAFRRFCYGGHREPYHNTRIHGALRYIAETEGDQRNAKVLKGQGSFEKIRAASGKDNEAMQDDV